MHLEAQRALAEEFLNLFDLAEARNKLIPQILGGGTVYRPARPFRTAAVRMIGKALVGRNFHLEGAANLEQAARLAEDHKVFFVCNHQTDADTPTKRFVLENSGFANLADEFIHLAGLKMIERDSIKKGFISWFAHSEDMILVATPFDYQKLDRIANSSINPTGIQEEILAAYRANCDSLNHKAMQEMVRLSRQGRLIGLYPEATRSRDGLLQQAPSQIATYFRREAWVVPMAINGLAEAFPPERSFRLRRVNLSLVVGSPFPTTELWPGGTRQRSEQADRLCMDLVMAHIAILNPEIAHPGSLSHYQALLAV